MAHERHVATADTETSSDRSFGIVFCAFFALLGVWWLWSGSAHWYGWFALSAVVLAVALARPALLAIPNRLWLRFGHLLGMVTTPIVVGIIFYGVMTPLGLLKRTISQQDPLRLGFDPRARSYWIMRDPPGPSPESIKRQF